MAAAFDLVSEDRLCERVKSAAASYLVSEDEDMLLVILTTTLRRLKQDSYRCDCTPIEPDRARQCATFLFIVLCSTLTSFLDKKLLEWLFVDYLNEVKEAGIYDSSVITGIIEWSRARADEEVCEGANGSGAVLCVVLRKAAKSFKRLAACERDENETSRQHKRSKQSSQHGDDERRRLDVQAALQSLILRTINQSNVGSAPELLHCLNLALSLAPTAFDLAIRNRLFAHCSHPLRRHLCAATTRLGLSTHLLQLANHFIAWRPLSSAPFDPHYAHHPQRPDPPDPLDRHHRYHRPHCRELDLATAANCTLLQKYCLLSMRTACLCLLTNNNDGDDQQEQVEENEIKSNGIILAQSIFDGLLKALGCQCEHAAGVVACPTVAKRLSEVLQLNDPLLVECSLLALLMVPQLAHESAEGADVARVSGMSGMSGVAGVAEAARVAGVAGAFGTIKNMSTIGSVGTAGALSMKSHLQPAHFVRALIFDRLGADVSLAIDLLFSAEVGACLLLYLVRYLKWLQRSEVGGDQQPPSDEQVFWLLLQQRLISCVDKDIAPFNIQPLLRLLQCVTSGNPP